jgi:hypothetical protein
VGIVLCRGGCRARFVGILWSRTLLTSAGPQEPTESSRGTPRGRDLRGYGGICLKRSRQHSVDSL